MNRLLSKGMSNIYSKVREKLTSKPFDFLSLKHLLSGQFLGSSNSRIAISLSFKISCCNLNITHLGAKTCMVFLLF